MVLKEKLKIDYQKENQIYNIIGNKILIKRYKRQRYEYVAILKANKKKHLKKESKFILKELQ